MGSKTEAGGAMPFATAVLVGRAAPDVGSLLSFVTWQGRWRMSPSRLSMLWARAPYGSCCMNDLQGLPRHSRLRPAPPAFAHKESWSSTSPIISCGPMYLRFRRGL